MRLRRVRRAFNRERSLVLLHQPFLGGPGGDLCPGGIAQLGKDIADMGFYCASTDDQRVSDLTAGLPVRNSHCNLALARGQSIISSPGRAPGRWWWQEGEQVMGVTQEICAQVLFRDVEGELVDQLAGGHFALLGEFIPPLYAIAFPQSQVNAPEQRHGSL